MNDNHDIIDVDDVSITEEKEGKYTDFREVSDAIDEQIEKQVKDNDKTDPFCFMCNRRESEVGHLIDIAPGLHVCTECMSKTISSMGGFTPGFNPNMHASSDEGTKEDTKEDAAKPHGIPNISFLNLSDMGMGGLGSIFGHPQVKQKKKKKDENAPKPVFDINNIPAPHIIKGKLDEYVVGQEKAKKSIAVAVYNHYKRITRDEKDDIEIEKSNMLMVGPTGSGKTYIVKTLARLLDVPLAIADATSLTEAGYIGDDIESVLSKLLAAADNDVERAEKGIVYIDEIDKLAKKKNANQRDVSGESVQQGMLRLLEGAEVEVPVGASSKNAMVPTAIIDTTNILFICGGAFPDIEEIIKQRLNKSSSMGFKADLKDKYDGDKNILSKVTVSDLKEFGMIPEFIGRLPVLFSLEGLDEDMLVQILTKPRNAIIKQYQKLLALDEVDLQFEEAALHAIAKKALEKEMGARALRAVIEEFMLDIMYEIPKDDNIGSVLITENYIEGTGGPSITMRTSAITQKD